MAINESLLTNVLQGLAETQKTKQAIYEAIVKKGVAQFPVSTKFSDYPKKIEEIVTNQVSLDLGAKFGYSNWNTIPEAIKNYIETRACLELGGLTNMFTYCQSLISAELNVKGNISLDRMFYNCVSLQKVVLTGTGQTKSFSGTFANCSKLEEISMVITYGNTFTSMFEGCASLVNTISAPFNQDDTDCSSMYKDSGIKQIINNQVIPDQNSITNASYMFKNCPIQTVQSLDLHLCQNMTGMFENDNPVTALLLTVGTLNTSYCKIMDSMFRGQSKLTSIDKIDMAECTSASNMFVGCSSLTNLTIENLGQAASLTEMDFTSITNWESESLSNTINSMYNRSGYSGAFNLRFSSNVKSSLTSAQISTLQAKGYTIA